MNHRIKAITSMLTCYLLLSREAAGFLSRMCLSCPSICTRHQCGGDGARAETGDGLEKCVKLMGLTCVHADKKRSVIGWMDGSIDVSCSEVDGEPPQRRVSRLFNPIVNKSMLSRGGTLAVPGVPT